MSTKVHLKEVHAEIIEWKSQVAFSIDELKVFKTQLTEVLGRNNSAEFSALGEHFENQLRLQHEAFDDLADELQLADETIALRAGHNGSADHVLIDKNPVLQDKVQTAIRIYSELKVEFRAFEVKWF